MASTSRVTILINSMEHDSKFNLLGIEVSLIKVQHLGSKHKVRVSEFFKTDYIEDVRKGKDIFDFSWNMYHSFQRVPDDEQYFFLFEINQKMQSTLSSPKPIMWSVISAVEALQITSSYWSMRRIAQRLDLYEYPFSLSGPRLVVPRSHLLVHLYCPHYFLYHVSLLKVIGTGKKTTRALQKLIVEEQCVEKWLLAFFW